MIADTEERYRMAFNVFLFIIKITVNQPYILVLS